MVFPAIRRISSALFSRNAPDAAGEGTGVPLNVR